MRKAAAIPRPEFDIVVTTEAIYKKLKEYVASQSPVPDPLSGFESLSLYGIDILAYGDEQEAKAAAIALRGEGKRVNARPGGVGGMVLRLRPSKPAWPSRVRVRERLKAWSASGERVPLPRNDRLEQTCEPIAKGGGNA